MKAVKDALLEVYGLFVEDGTLALLILVWVAIAVLVFPRLPGGVEWGAPLLFVGLAALLLENVRRSARK
jgi:hypothetical protein